jgi:hypothetical protein
MKLTILGIIAATIVAFALQSSSAQAPETIKARGCLQGNGSNENPWALRGVVLPSPPGVAPAGAAGARGDGGARGAGGRGRGDAAGPVANAADGGRGAAGGGRGDGGRGDGAGRGATPPPPAPAPPPQPPQDFRLTGVDMTPWRNMFVEVEGTLGPRPTSGLREFQVSSARSAYGECR